MTIDPKKADLLDKVSKLRVTDIRDGMDWLGLHHQGTVSPDIRPLYRAKACGFAQTLQHVPTQRAVPKLTPDEYTKWAYEYWYGQVMKHDLGSLVGAGDFLVVDTCGTQTPAVGSMDSLIWAAKGVRGVLTNGGARDTDETIYQKAIPVWSRWVVQPMYQGRVEFGGHSMPVEIGGQLVRPGDLIVADGDGAIVVPIEVAEDVVKYAIQESENDKRARTMLFKRLGIDLDEGCESVFDVPPHPYALTEEALDNRLRPQRG